MRFVSLSIIFLIFFMGSALAETSINTNSIQTSAINTSASNLDINTVTDFTGNSIKGVNNLFFSSKTFIVQESNGDDIVFQLDNSSGIRKDFLTLDNSALSVALAVPLSVGSNQINNLADPTDPQDAATMSWVNANDDVETDTVWSLAGDYLVNGSGSLVLDESVLNSTIDDRDQFEANTDASTKCSTGQVLTGSGCVSLYSSSSDDSDSSLGNEGVNGLSFDTSTGVLSMAREHRSSLTQDLDGRYPTSDTNTQLDDQPAESTVDMNGNNIDNIGSEGTELGWKMAGSTQCDSSTDYAHQRIQLFDRNGNDGDLKKEFRVFVAGDDNHGHTGTYSIFVTQHIGESRFSNVIMTPISGKTGLLEVQSDGSEVWIRPTVKWGNVYYRVESDERTGGTIPLNTRCNDPSGMDVANVGPFDYDWDSTALREYPSTQGNGNLDMNNNRIQNAEVEATQGLKIPVGQDAY